MSPIKSQSQIREFGGNEVEIKFQVSNIAPTDLFEQLQSLLSHGNLDGFQVYDKRINQHWMFNFDYYGYSENSKYIPVYHLVYFPRVNKHWFRKKEEVEIVGLDEDFWLKDPLTRRREYKEEYNFPLTPKLVKFYLEREQKQLSRAINFVGRVKREKFYFYIFNELTRRYYSVGVDDCLADHKKMSQLEVEYKWRLSNKCKKVDFLSIFEDFSNIAKFLLKRYPKNVSLTKLTKFTWLVQL